MAGCVVDRDIFKISHENLSSEIASQHKDWTPHQVRIEVARLFRPSYHQNMESVKQEVEDKKEYPGAPFVFENGEVNFIDGLRMTNILTFHENQLRDTPEKYSREQHETSLLIQTAFQNGATEVVTSYLEKNGQRDIVVMTLDRATGKGKMRIINTVNDHTMPEMQNIVKKNFSHLNETRPTTNAFILSDTHISKERIQQEFTAPDRQTYAVLKETVSAAKNTFREIQYTIASVDKFIQRSRNDRIKALPDVIGDSFIHQIRQMFEHKKNKKTEVLVLQHNGAEKEKPKKHDINLFVRPLERMRLTQGKIQEKVTMSVATLLFVRATGIGIGGAFVSLESLVRLPQVSLESPKNIRKEKTKKQKYKERLLRQKRTLGKMRTFRMSERFKKMTKKEQRVFRLKEKTLLVKEKKILRHEQRRSIRRKEVLFRRKEKKLLQRKERRSIQKQEKKLWEIVRTLVKKGTIIEQKSSVKNVHRNESTRKLHLANKDKKVVMISKERHSTRQEKQHVIDFSIALVIWFLLHMQVSSRHRQENKHTVSVIKDAQSKELVQKEPAPWLLFAIIWHLAMIREQGMGRGITDPYYTKKTVPKQKIIQRAVLPPMGVIFALAS